MSNLNSSQTEAVLHGEGPMLVVAGPGAGKTRIVSHRIARLVSEAGTPPESILAITFTNKAAREMRERVIALLGEEHSEAGTSLWMGTFHSVCNRILRQHAKKIGYTPGFHIYDQADAVSALVDVCVSLGCSRKDARRASRDIASAISLVKSDGGTAADMEQGRTFLAGESGSLPASAVLEEYDSYLASNDAMDFDDLLLNTAKLFADFGEVLASYQERFRYVFIDEYQDTNKIQNALALMLAEPQNNLFAVGDPDQSIYKFRGAEIKNIEELARHFPDMKTVDMGENYRSVPAIVETASALIAHNPRVFDRRLSSQRQPAASGQPVSFKILADSFAETDWIAETITSQASNGHDFSDMAVFYRKHSLAEPLERALAGRSIPYKISGGTGFFERAEIRDCLAMLRCASGNADTIAVKRAAAKTAKGLGAKSLLKLEKQTEAEGTGWAEALTRPKDAGLSGKAAKAAEKFGDLIAEASQSMTESGPAAALDVFLEEYDLESCSTEEAGRVESFRTLAGEYGTYEDMAEFLSLAAGEMNSDGSKPENSANSVSLMTYHASKGLEFPVVFLMAMEEDIMFPKWAGTAPEDKEEARRLVYVGATRAEDRLYVSAAMERASDYSNGGGEGKVLSGFWTEMGGGSYAAQTAASRI